MFISKGNFYGIYSVYHFIIKYSDCVNHFVSLSLKMNRLDYIFEAKFD